MPNWYDPVPTSPFEPIVNRQPWSPFTPPAPAAPPPAAVPPGGTPPSGFGYDPTQGQYTQPTMQRRGALISQPGMPNQYDYDTVPSNQAWPGGNPLQDLYSSFTNVPQQQPPPMTTMPVGPITTAPPTPAFGRMDPNWQPPRPASWDTPAADKGGQLGDPTQNANINYWASQSPGYVAPPAAPAPAPVPVEPGGMVPAGQAPNPGSRQATNGSWYAPVPGMPFFSPQTGKWYRTQDEVDREGMSFEQQDRYQAGLDSYSNNLVYGSTATGGFDRGTNIPSMRTNGPPPPRPIAGTPWDTQLQQFSGANGSAAAIPGFDVNAPPPENGPSGQTGGITAAWYQPGAPGGVGYTAAVGTVGGGNRFADFPYVPPSAPPAPSTGNIDAIPNLQPGQSTLITIPQGSTVTLASLTAQGLSAYAYNSDGSTRPATDADLRPGSSVALVRTGAANTTPGGGTTGAPPATGGPTPAVPPSGSGAGTDTTPGASPAPAANPYVRPNTHGSEGSEYYFSGNSYGWDRFLPVSPDQVRGAAGGEIPFNGQGWTRGDLPPNATVRVRVANTDSHGVTTYSWRTISSAEPNAALGSEASIQFNTTETRGMLPQEPETPDPTPTGIRGPEGQAITTAGTHGGTTTAAYTVPNPLPSGVTYYYYRPNASGVPTRTAARTGDTIPPGTRYEIVVTASAIAATAPRAEHGGQFARGQSFIAGDSTDGNPNPELVTFTHMGAKVTPLDRMPRGVPKFGTGGFFTGYTPPEQTPTTIVGGSGQTTAGQDYYANLGSGPVPAPTTPAPSPYVNPPGSTGSGMGTTPSVTPSTSANASGVYSQEFFNLPPSAQQGYLAAEAARLNIPVSDLQFEVMQRQMGGRTGSNLVRGY